MSNQQDYVKSFFTNMIEQLIITNKQISSAEEGQKKYRTQDLRISMS
jgi:hypothetical protein